VKRISVVAAVIERDARILICQRRSDDAFPLKWEFPGGKIRPGEEPEAALRRELEEELGVRATIGPEIYRTRHIYGDSQLEAQLHFFAASIGDAVPRNLAFEHIEWSGRADLAAFDFLEADRELVRLLTTNELALPEIHPESDRPPSTTST
jgi:8-oxo-dGTP diphosphatase